MREFITDGGFHKWTVEQKTGFYVFTLFENMGGRWVQLGPPEVWSSSAALELLEAIEA